MKSKLILIALCSTLAVVGCSEEKAAVQSNLPEVIVQKVTRQDIPSVMEFVGHTQGSIDAEVRARVDGVLTGVHFDEGSEVTEGQLLYTIDPASFNAKVAEAQGVLAQAQTQLVKAASDAARLKPLVKIKAVSERQYDAAVAAEGAAVGAVDAAKASLESAQIELSYTKIHAPTTGIIGTSKAKVGEYVGKAPNPIVLNTVSALDEIHISFGLSEKEYLGIARSRREKLDAGETPESAVFELLLADGSLHKDKGSLAHVGREVDKATGTVEVEAKFPNPHRLIRPGQYGKVRVTLGKREDVIVVPKKAVRELQGQFLIFIVKGDNTVEERMIKVGPTLGELQVVEEGLKDGEVIVIDGVQRVKAGIAVTPKQAS